MRPVVVAVMLAVAALAVAGVATAAGKQPPPAFLTGPSAGKPVDIALDYLHRERKALGLAPGDLGDMVVSDLVVDRDTDTTHIYLRQRSKGIEVAEGVINVSVAKDGSIITLGNRFVPNLAAAIRSSGSLRSAEEGVEAGAKAVGLTPKQALKRQRAGGGAAQETVFDGAGISERPITAKLVYVRDGAGALRLAWQATILEPGGAHWWEVSTDASTGEPLAKVDHVDHETSSYNVFPFPVEAPSFGARSIVTSPADPLASPFGWHDTDGVEGAEDTHTMGNNATAGTVFGGASDGGAALDFDFPLDLGHEPDTYEPASVTNVFYALNTLHDVLYRHGFDEDAGNFQSNNYGRGGLGGDAVLGLVQDPFGSDNASFTTVPDGESIISGAGGLMRLGVFNPGSPPNRDSALDNGIIAHEYGHGVSNRLVGGPANVSCLENVEQMGEGWSDFLALVMTARGGGLADQNRGVGTYVLNQPPDGDGLRGAPYSPDMSIWPYTYGDIKFGFGFVDPHFVGSVWAGMLWEVYWNLVGEHGFHANLSDDWTTGGNTLALRLYLDSLKLTPCSPGFVDGRDAFLLADQNLTGGANQCLIWKGFAKRGLGVSASQGSSTNDGTEAFDLPVGVCSAQASAAPSPLAGHAEGTGTDSRTLTLSNVGLAGSPALAWTVTEAATSCAGTGDVPWLTVGPAGGSVSPGGSAPLTVGFNAAGLEPGTPHTAVLCIASNDQHTPTLAVPVTFDVDFSFTGFFGAAANTPTLNTVNAGSSFTPTFALGGNWGLAIFAAENPQSQQIDCSTKDPIGAAATASGSVSYNSSTGRYTYSWKTLKTWSGTCRQLLLRFRDQTERKVYVKLTK